MNYEFNNIIEINFSFYIDTSYFKKGDIIIHEYDSCFYLKTKDSHGQDVNIPFVFIGKMAKEECEKYISKIKINNNQSIL